MNLRIAYYVVALAISLAAFAGAYGYSYPSAADLAGARAFAGAATAKAERANDRATVASKAAADRAYVAADYRAGEAAYAAELARAANYDANQAVGGFARAARTATIAAYGMATAVSVAAIAGAYILDKRTQPKPMTSPRQDE